MTNRADREVTVFNAALELPANQRAAYLDEACAGDAGLRQRVEALLRAPEEAAVFLEDRVSEAKTGSGAPLPGGPSGTDEFFGPKGTVVIGASVTEGPGADRIGRRSERDGRVRFRADPGREPA